MQEINIFKLADILGFDIRQTNLKNSVATIMIVDENYDQIPGFNSNKVILYNNKKKIELIKNSIAEHTYNYIKAKDESNKIHLVEVNGKNKYKIDINGLANNCIKKGLIISEKDIKKYKNAFKMHFYFTSTLHLTIVNNVIKLY